MESCSTSFSTIFQSIVLFLNTWFFSECQVYCQSCHCQWRWNYTPTLPEHLSSHPVFSGVRTARSFVFCVMFGRWSFVPLFFFFWPLCCLSFFTSQLLITPSVSSNIYCAFVLFILAIVLSVLLHFTASDYPFGIFLVPLSFFLLAIVLSVLHFTASDCSFGIFKLFLYLCPFSFGHCIVCSSSLHGFWLPLWYLQTFLVSLFFFFWPLYCLSSFTSRLLIAPLVSSNFSCAFVLCLLTIVLSVLHFTASDYPFGIFKLFFCLNKNKWK